MILLPVLLAPTVIVAASAAQRRFGPAASGWVVALPIGFGVAVIAVVLDAGPASAATLALSAAAQVPAQVGFALAFAVALKRHGLGVGAAAGLAAYVAGSVVLVDVPNVVAALIAVPVLVIAPRYMPRGRPLPGAVRGASITAILCVTAVLIVVTAVVITRAAGADMAGAVAAFPSLSTTAAIAAVAIDGRLAGTHSLGGLVRSLPCYLVFCVVVAATVPWAGLAAVILGVAACLVAARFTWRTVPLLTGPDPDAHRPHPALVAE